jgi:hypothetical protein
MNIKTTTQQKITAQQIKELADWIQSLKEAAKNDEAFSIAWFNGTKDAPFSIVGGWLDGFSPDYSDLTCTSKSNPTYAMCVQIAINEGPYAYTDFELMNMPIDEEGEVDDTCIALEHEDDPEALAQFFWTEWERFMSDYNKDEE